jgi:uroporphyrinogen decarboxylase
MRDGRAIGDLMKPAERLKAYSEGRPIDRLPCIPIVGNTAARVIGVKVSRLRNDGRLLAGAQVAAYKRFGYDGIRIFTDLYIQAEAMGAKVHTPLDETAFLENPAVSNINRIDEIKPIEALKSGLLREHLDAMERALEAVGREVPVTGALTGPFTNASFLIGTENLVRLTIRKPETVHRLCEIALETSLNYAEAMLRAGCSPSLTDPMASSTLISPKQFSEFAFPYLKKLVDYIHGHGKSVTLHICGKTHPVWEFMADTGADCLSIDNEASLTAAKSKVGNRVRLMGNVPPAAIMLQGAPRDVRGAVRKCVSQAHDNPRGFIVASGCSLPTETPFANIDAMMDAVREIGCPVNEIGAADWSGI